MCATESAHDGVGPSRDDDCPDDPFVRPSSPPTFGPALGHNSDAPAYDHEHDPASGDSRFRLAHTDPTDRDLSRNGPIDNGVGIVAREDSDPEVAS